jgi:diguanylate cyclase (GGDEF)-like protein/PAS domain S-box-containing protein
MSPQATTPTSGPMPSLHELEVGTRHDLLALILKHVDAHVFMKDAGGHYLYANPQVCAALQRPLEEILGHTDAELLPAEAAADLMTFDQQVLAAGQPLRREEKVVTQDGTTRTFLSEKMAIRQADGAAMLIGFATDITELKAIEAALRISQEDLHHILENLPFPIVVVETPAPDHWTDLRARCLFFNRHWLDTLGYGTADAPTAEELTRRLYPDPAYRREVWQRRTDAARHAAGNGGTAPAFEVRITAQDGTVHQMLSGTSVLGNRMIVSLQDITDLRQQQEALRISEERHRFLAENARDVIWTMEPDGRFSYLSPSVEAVRGFTPAEAMVQPLEQIHPPESLAHVTKWWNQMEADLAAGRTPVNFRKEMAYYRKDGSIFWTEVMAYPLLHPDGSLAQVVGVTRDMTEQRRAKEAIEKAAAVVRRSEEHYRLLSSNLYDAILHMDDESIVTWASPSLRRVLGYDPEDWIGHPVTDFLVPDDAVRARANIERCVTQQEPVIARYTAYDQQGRLRHAESYATPYLKTDGTRDGIVVSFHLIDTEVAIEKELERRARTDELTSLLNRREIFERLHDLTGRHVRTGHRVAVLFCDLDKFKEVNDTHGHRVGDEVLGAVADRLRASLRHADDLAARVGGDELMIVLHGVHDQADALGVAEKLRAAVAEPIATSAGPLQITISIGVALARSEESTEELISRADTAMYQAKQTGRNQVVPVS